MKFIRRAFDPSDTRQNRTLRAVSSEAELRAAIRDYAENNIRFGLARMGMRIVIVESFAVSAPIELSPDVYGLTIASNGSAVIYNKGDVECLFRVACQRVTLEGLTVANDSVSLWGAFAKASGSCDHLVILDCYAVTNQFYVETATDRSANLVLIGNYHAGVPLGSDAGVQLHCANGCLAGNRINGLIVGTSGQRNRFIGNHFTTAGSSHVTTTASSGGNRFAANTGMDSAALHADDIDADAADAGDYVERSGDTMTGALTLPNGSASTPALSTAHSSNTGWYSSSAGTWVYVASGAAVATLSTFGLTPVGANRSLGQANARWTSGYIERVIAEAGTATNPSLRFRLTAAEDPTGTLGIGLYRVSSTKLGISTGGALRVAVDSTGLAVVPSIYTSGDVVIDDQADGVCMQDTVTGTWYRVQVTNGALALTALGGKP